MSPLLGAIEAGGTKLVCAAAQGDEVLAETRIATTTPTVTLGAAQRFFESITAERGAFSAIGIAPFGPVDLRRASPTFGLGARSGIVGAIALARAALESPRQ